MRVAALYDVHGNLPALEAVLADVDAAGVDVVVAGGDVVWGPWPSECLELLRRHGAVLVRGNCERDIVTPESERDRWCAEALTPSQLELIAELPLSIEILVDGLGKVLFCHASPRRDDEILTRITPTEYVADALAATDAVAVVCGHTHVQYERKAGGVRLVNAGSVGLPYEDDPGARWALLGPDVELRRTPYAYGAAAVAIRASGLPDADEFADTVATPPSAAEATEHFERMRGA